MLIFGSWAARQADEAGAVPHDVNVLVVGAGVPWAEAYEAADRAQARLSLPVNPIRTPVQWADAGDPLSSQIRSSPTLIVIAGEDVHGMLAVR